MATATFTTAESTETGTRNGENMPVHCKCETIDWYTIFGKQQMSALYPRLKDLQHAAQSGCHFCSMLFFAITSYVEDYSRLRADIPENVIKTREIQVDCPCWESGTVLIGGSLAKGILLVGVLCGEADGHSIPLSLSTLSHNPSLNYLSEVRERVNRKKSDPSKVAMGTRLLPQYFMKDCIDNHKLCANPSSKILPTRVLDLKPDDKTIGLQLVQSLGRKGQWCALSYCWGGVMSYRTTIENLTQRLSSLDLVDLPKTIQDAITVTRQLGVRYLWVDSICIIQDSNEDWTSEAGRMREVYRNAYVTIAASDASNAKEGLFIERPENRTQPFEIKYVDHDGFTVQRWMHAPRIPWKAKHTNSILQSRAWTLQETQISTRVLHYHKDEILWQCREGVRRELIPSYSITANDIFVPRRPFDAYNKDATNVFTLWCQSVENYTSRKLTYKKDRLVAISGLAAEIAAFITSRKSRRLATSQEYEMFSVAQEETHWALPKVSQRDHRKYHAYFDIIEFLEMRERAENRPRFGGGLPVRMSLRNPLFPYGSDLGENCQSHEHLPLSETRMNELWFECGMEDYIHFLKTGVDNPEFNDELESIHTHRNFHIAFRKLRTKVYNHRHGINDSSSDSDLEDEDFNKRFTQTEAYQDSQAKMEKNDVGVLIDLDNPELGFINSRPNMYIYNDESSPIKAMIEMPFYTMDDRYYCGIWRADIQHSLCWSCTVPGYHPVTYRAPSWSWASLDDAQVVFPILGSERIDKGSLYCDSNPGLLEARTNVPGDNPFADAVSGRLVLLAEIMDMPIYHDLDDPIENCRTIDEKLEYAKQHKLSYYVVMQGLHVKARSQALRDWPSLEGLRLDEWTSILSPDLKLLRVDLNHGLLLEPVVFGNSPSCTVYRRIGIWLTPWMNNDSIQLHNIDGWETRIVTII